MSFLSRVHQLAGMPAFFLAARNSLRQKRRTLIAISAVAFGITALILAGGFIEWGYHSMRETVIYSQLGHIQISKAGYTDKGTADPFRYIMSGQDRGVAALEKLAEIKTISPRLSFAGLISRGEETLSFLGEGMIPSREIELTRNLIVLAGRNMADDDPKGLILGEGLARALSVKPGDSIILVANTAKGGVNMVEGHVRGIFQTANKAYDDFALRAPLPFAQQLMKVSGTHVSVVLLHQTEDTQKALDKISALLPAGEYEIQPWNALADFYNKTVELYSRQIAVIKVIIAAIIVLSISNTLSMAVMERTSEIGTIMAVGTTRREIFTQFLAEGALVGILGGLVGIAIGLVLAAIISAIGIPLPPPPGQSRAYVGQIFPTWGMGIESLFLAFFTTLIAATIPAWRASRLTIVDALRHNR